MAGDDREEQMRIRLAATALVMALAAAPAAAQSGGPDLWADLVASVFDGRPMEDGAGIISLEAPYRAEDAAIVPLAIRSQLPAGADLRIEKITLVIDANPSPVAAEFSFGSERQVREIETRVRVDAYTDIHAVAELSDGRLYMVAAFVKAAGGCSAPAAKTTGAAAEIGEMRLRSFDEPDVEMGGLIDAQLMIRHPNNSGLQRDLLTNYYIPAYFVRDIEVSVGDDLLFRMQGGISISENPTFRFTYEGDESEPVAVRAVDTKEAAFEAAWPGPDGGAS